MVYLEDFWHKSAGFYSCGYVRNSAGNYLSGAELNAFFAGFATAEDLIRALAELNGCFALIREYEGEKLAVVDKTRSFPLFWNAKGELSDKSERLAKLDIDALQSTAPELISEYLICGYLSHSDTLHPDLRQIPAGHYLRQKTGKAPALYCYYRREHHPHKDVPVQELLADLHQLHQKIAAEIVQALDNRTVVIPLSGGYDSRLIAYLLSILGYPKIITFSYDNPKSRESHISQATAKQLKLPWHFVEHTHASWYQAFHSTARRDFYHYAVNASSSAHIQDWQAVKELKAKGIVPEDSVFMPGHTGDFLQSGHLTPAFVEKESFNRQELIDEIIAKHYRLWPNPSEEEREGFSQRIQRVINAPEVLSANEAASLFEYWNLQERQAKFILNSLRVYEYFGYEWQLFHWDARLIAWWAQVPLEQRYGRKLWELYAREYLPIPLPVYQAPYLGERVIDKALRILYGELRNVRYGRFAPRYTMHQYAREKLKNYLRADLKYPGFIQPDKALIRCDVNAIQALVALYEAPFKRG